jgi:hypothetical protein
VQGQTQDDSAKAPSTIYACDVLPDCRSCMLNGTNCVFAAGECLQECRNDGASCYSALSHPDLDTKGICDLYDADNAKCNSQATCQSCVLTVKSDQGQCKWYPDAFNKLGACFGGGLGPFGTGEITCDAGNDTSSTTTDPPSPSSIPATTSGPVETTIKPTTQTPTTLAPDPPTDAPATKPVVTNSSVTTAPPSSTSTMDLEVTCQAAASNCESCLEATCAWLPSIEACVPDCSSMADDAECYAAAAESPVTGQLCRLAENVTADREVCLAQENCEACLEANISDGSACQWYKDVDNGLSWCGMNGCNMDGICGESTCDVVSINGTDDTEGASNATTTSNTTTIPVSIGEEDSALCGRKNYCFTCTSTIQSDGVTPCAWYVDPNAGKEWCGTGGCDVNGICGETDESVCQFPTDPPFTSAPALDLTAAPAVTNSAVTRHFSSIWSVVVAMTLVRGCVDVV